MLRLAFDFIIAWREIRARPNAYGVFSIYPAFCRFFLRLYNITDYFTSTSMRVSLAATAFIR